MTKIFIIRHAEAEGNIYRRSHGHFNGQVTGKGYLQIEQLRERFKHEKIDAVYSSDLSRTLETAAAISEIHGLRINADERLREVSLGEWEDVAWGDIKHNFPVMSEYFGSDPASWSIDGSEVYENVRKRVKDCVSEIGLINNSRSVAVFSHGFAIRAFLCELMGIPSHKTELVPYCDNTAVALLRFENGNFSIEYHGDNSHLHNGSSTLENQTWWRDEEERKSEDLRYVQFDEKRDAPILKLCGREVSSKQKADLEFTALLDDEPAGIIRIDADGDSGDSAGRISLIYLKPELRRMNFGVQLLGQAVSECRKLRREKLRLEAEAGSLLMGFCEKFGFVKIGDSGSLCILEKNIRNW